MTQGQEQEKKLTTKDYVFLVSQGVSNTVGIPRNWFAS